GCPFAALCPFCSNHNPKIGERGTALEQVGLQDDHDADDDEDQRNQPVAVPFDDGDHPAMGAQPCGCGTPHRHEHGEHGHHRRGRPVARAARNSTVSSTTSSTLVPANSPAPTATVPSSSPTAAAYGRRLAARR